MSKFRKPTIDYTDSPLCVTHDMACPVCRNQSAVLELDYRGDTFLPCWDCQYKGWKTVNPVRYSWLRRKLLEILL
jgi:hypothetical protein